MDSCSNCNINKLTQIKCITSSNWGKKGGDTMKNDNPANYAYKFRLYPNKSQQQLINKTFGCVRYVYNKLLADNKKQYEETGKSKTKSYAYFKKDDEWLNEVDSMALSNAQQNVKTAYKNFFRELKKGNVAFPKFKSKKDRHQSYTTNKSTTRNNIYIEGKYIRLPKLGLIKMVKHREVEGIIKSVTIS